VKYEDFSISMEPPSLDTLAKLIRHAVLPAGTVRAELLNFACEIEARMQHLAQERPAKPDEDWLA